jgi:hypothetical protein
LGINHKSMITTMARTNPLADVFNEIFDRKLTKKIPHHTAYEEAEEEFEGEFKHRKYSSFESFRISRSRRIKKR